MERPMPRVSVVVPIFNVEQWLGECLESIRTQTFGDLEVIMVDDGSPDGSAAIAERFAARDARFRLISRPNGGLSAARNTGIDAATGEYLSFVDSDDVLARDALERLVGALEKTGSDFATGNVERITPEGIRQAYFLSRAFTRTRLKTHVTQHPGLLADRPAWNKLWRRSFWDEQGLRFPEGRVNEDIPVVIPAHFAARSVDVIADTVYYWRTREAGEPSITQRTLEPAFLHDRMAAISEVIAYLDQHATPLDRSRYEETVLMYDLRYILDVLDQADEEYQGLFIDRVNAVLDDADPRILGRLPAGERAKWQLVRERRRPELIALLEASRRAAPPLRIRLARRIPERHRRRLRGLVEAARR
jgi:CDP-glycerol glycerophosphotransferase